LEAYGGSHQTLLANVRAGNIIGGGDWAVDRLIPDIMRGASQGKPVRIRNPLATRPWQHVLDPLAGYLLVGQKLIEGRREFAQAWNFGPAGGDSIAVIDVANHLKTLWPSIDCRSPGEDRKLHEAHSLRLDCSKAALKLGWRTIWERPALFEKTVNWYRAYYEENRIISAQQLADYVCDAQREHMPWVLA
jgi:CDP-glucose 4,6-dehydratase